MNGWNLTKFVMCIDFDEKLVGIIMRKIAQIYNRVIALDLSILFSLNFLRMNGWNLTRFCIHLDIDKI